MTADEARQQAALAASRAAEWLLNGGPNGYDIQEALAQLDKAECWALSALVASAKEAA